MPKERKAGKEEGKGSKDVFCGFQHGDGIG